MRILLALIPAAAALLPVAAQAAATCESLASVALPNAKIDAVKTMPAGSSFTATQQGKTVTLKGLPAFCRVALTVKPVPDSDIKIEVWLPANWNGKLQAVGNGGWSGTIGYEALGKAVRGGYATVSTDTGHKSVGGSFMHGHPEKMVDYDWRAVHEMTVKAKALIPAFYGSPQKYAFWNGCSTGGRQGLKEATMFPGDYDGLVIGDPANMKAERNTWQMALSAAVAKSPANYISVAKVKALHQAVLKSCDAIDGVKDGLIENPKLCKFDIASVACKGAETDACLTPAQLQIAKLILSPGKSGGKEYQPGLEIGSEVGYYPDRKPGWADWASEAKDPPPADLFRFEVFQNPDWDWKSFNAETAYPLAAKANKDEAARPEDLGKFLQRGKILFYHGWADPSVAPQATIDYYNTALKTTPTAKENARLFMVPGMGHCLGGDGVTDQFDVMASLESWVIDKKAPERILATHVEAGKVTRSRPLCPYPQMAVYKGTGNTDDATNFTCKAS